MTKLTDRLSKQPIVVYYNNARSGVDWRRYVETQDPAVADLAEEILSAEGYESKRDA